MCCHDLAFLLNVIFFAMYLVDLNWRRVGHADINLTLFNTKYRNIWLWISSKSTQEEILKAE